MATLHSDNGKFLLRYGKPHTVRFKRPFARKPNLEWWASNDSLGGNYAHCVLLDEQIDQFTIVNEGKKYAARVQWRATGELFLPVKRGSALSSPLSGAAITTVLVGIAALIATAWTCIQIWDWATK